MIPVVVGALVVPISAYLVGYGIGRLHRRFHYIRFGLMLLLVVVSLSGCLTPAKLTSMSQRADVLSQGAKTQACAQAAAKAAEAVVAALEAMSAPAAMKAAEVACLECVKDKDCADDQECVSGHCQKRKK